MLLKVGSRVRYKPRLVEQLDGTIIRVWQGHESPYEVKWDAYPVSRHDKCDIKFLDIIEYVPNI